MYKLQRINFIISILSLGLAFLILIIPITKMNHIQVIGLQALYSTLDKSWLFIRSLTFLLFSIAGVIVPLRNAQPLKTSRTLRYFVAVIFLGLVASLIIFYGFSCCDSPVIFFMGFPFSWLQGITQVQHYLPLPAFQYLITNLFQIDWSINPFSLFIDILFWYNVCLLVVCNYSAISILRTVEKLIAGN